MIYLLLSILSSTAIFVIFRWIKTFNADILTVIVINYITACFLGLSLFKGDVSASYILNAEWFWGAFGLGFLFIAIFNVMALTSQRNGLSVASVASKMSVIIPIVFGLHAYNESLGTQKLIGILLAFIAVYFTSIKTTKDTVLTRTLYLPILLFFGSGIIDTAIKYIETSYVPKNGIPIFSATIFGCAAIIGIAILMNKVMSKKTTLKFKAVPFGILLGVVNYASVYYLLKALQIEDLESSSLFTINNVAIVALTTLIGLILFQEHISKKNWLGIIVAVISIILVTS